ASTETVDVQNVKTQVKAIRPDVLICDIDGAEAALIPLMDLNKVRAAVVTLNPQTTGPEGVAAVFQAFMAAGLSYFPKLSSQKVVTFRRAWPVK
ncbi:MAG: FkbM family methyltransferase, partial [Pseudomonadota bacterium]